MCYPPLQIFVAVACSKDGGLESLLEHKCVKRFPFVLFTLNYQCLLKNSQVLSDVPGQVFLLAFLLQLMQQPVTLSDAVLVVSLVLLKI